MFKSIASEKPEINLYPTLATEQKTCKCSHNEKRLSLAASLSATMSMLMNTGQHICILWNYREYTTTFTKIRTQTYTHNKLNFFLRTSTLWHNLKPFNFTVRKSLVLYSSKYRSLIHILHSLTMYFHFNLYLYTTMITQNYLLDLMFGIQACPHRNPVPANFSINHHGLLIQAAAHSTWCVADDDCELRYLVTQT